MPMFMAQFACTPQAWVALVHTPQDRARPLPRSKTPM